MTTRVSGGAALTVEEAAVRTGIPARTIDEWCRSGRLPSARGGGPGHPVICLHDLVAFLGDLAREADLERRPQQAYGGRADLVPGYPAIGEPPETRREAALRESLARHSARLRWIEDLAVGLEGAATVEEVAETLVAEIAGLVESDSARFYVVDPARSVCIGIARRDRTAEYDTPETHAVPLGTGFTGWVAEHGVPLLLTDASRDPRVLWSGGAPEPFSALAVPITVRGAVKGVFVLVRAGAARFDTEDLASLEIVAMHVSQAVRNVETMQTVERQRSDLQRRLESQRLLLESARELVSKAHPSEVLEHIAASLKRMVENDVLIIFRVDREAAVLRPILCLYREAGVAVDPVPLGVGLSGWVVANGQPALANDAVNDERTAGLPGYEDEGAESLLVLPLVWGGEVAGTLNVTRFGEGRAFSEQEVEIAQLFAAQAATALQNAERYEGLERQRSELERYVSSQRRLLEVSEKLLLARDPRDVLDTLGASLRSVVAYDSMQIHRADQAHGLQRPVFTADAYAGVVVESDLPVAVGLAGWVIAHGEAVLANDAHLDPRARGARQAPGDEDEDAPTTESAGREPQSVVAAPLFEKGRVSGVMHVTRLGAGAHFSEREFELVKLFAAQASIAIQNAEEHRAATARAQLDSLTGLRNHGAFQDEIAELIGRRGPFALLMLDLDEFKRFNDAEGHPAGDELLRRVSAAMASATRDADGLYRYGGDEFAVLLPGVSRSAAADVVERIRSAVAGVAAPGGAHVGVSAGIACYPADGRSREALVAHADETLYDTKRDAGRRRAS